MDEEVGVSQTSCYQFELKISGYSLEFLVSAATDCHVMEKLARPKSLQAALNSEKLVVPFPIIMRNSRSDGYAILDQIKLTVESNS